MNIYRKYQPGGYTVTTILLVLLSLLLAGCQGGPIMTTSAEQAAYNAVASQQSHGGRMAVIDQQSIQILQSQAIDDQTFVLIRYNQMSEGRQEKCLSMYETARGPLGLWSPRSGGGGCSGQISGTEPAPEPPLEAGGGSTGGSRPDDPGYSHAEGLVNQEDIEQVRVTWDDGQQQTVPVVNGSYLAIRSGVFRYKSFEGLNAAGDVVYNQTMEIAPGKMP